MIPLLFTNLVLSCGFQALEYLQRCSLSSVHSVYKFLSTSYPSQYLGASRDFLLFFLYRGSFTFWECKLIKPLTNVIQQKTNILPPGHKNILMSLSNLYFNIFIRLFLDWQYYKINSEKWQIELIFVESLSRMGRKSSVSPKSFDFT